MASPWPERLHIRQMTLAYREHDVRLQRIEVARLGTAPVALSVDRIDGSMVGLPFWASARLRSGETGWQANGVLASGSGEVVLRFDGTNLGGDDGSLRLVTDRLHFAPDGLQPAALWPTLGAFFSSVSGTLQAELTWPEGPAALLIEDLGSRTPYGPVGSIDGRIELSGIQPPRTAMPQRLRIEGVQLEALVEGLAIEALDAAGTIDADLRFSFKDSGRLHIDEGEIRSRGPGVLRYRAGGPPGALADQGESVAFMLRALGDFRYETLTATVRGYLDEDLTIALQLQGANPELYEGHPIELNVNLEAPFLPLALAGRKVMALPAMVRDALARHQD